jgi:antitoxin component YwqK of YwqJK toxin-antitoxin module
MKRILTILFLLLFSSLSNAQHSDRFLEIVNELKEVESKSDTIFYRNGEIRWINNLTTYQYDFKTYRTHSGKQIQYYKNGQIANKSILDKYGNTLSWNGFDRNGNKTIESITTEIDSNAESLTEFLESEEHLTFKRKNKYYKCSNKLEVCYLFKEGKILNGNKIGLWKTHSENGILKKEKTY